MSWCSAWSSFRVSSLGQLLSGHLTLFALVRKKFFHKKLSSVKGKQTESQNWKRCCWAQCNQTRCFQAISLKNKNTKTELFILVPPVLIFTPFPISCFHPQFLASLLCALTLERSQKVPYYSLRRKSNCDSDPAAFGGRAEGAWSSALCARLSSSAVSAAEKARWINAYLHSTKPEESEFPSARVCEGSAGK